MSVISSPASAWFLRLVFFVWLFVCFEQKHVEFFSGGTIQLTWDIYGFEERICV